jgi:hypothetical protein
VTRDHVVCKEAWLIPESVTPFGERITLGPCNGLINEPCGALCPVVKEADVMDFRCPRGHRFYAQPKDIVRA